MKSELPQLACYTKIGLCPRRIEIFQGSSNCILYHQVNIIFSKFISLMLFISANKGLPIYILILSGQMNCTVSPCKAAPLKLKILQNCLQSSLPEWHLGREIIVFHEHPKGRLHRFQVKELPYSYGKKKKHLSSKSKSYEAGLPGLSKKWNLCLNFNQGLSKFVLWKASTFLVSTEESPAPISGTFLKKKIWWFKAPALLTTFIVVDKTSFMIVGRIFDTNACWCWM